MTVSEAGFPSLTKMLYISVYMSAGPSFCSSFQPAILDMRHRKLFI